MQSLSCNNPIASFPFLVLSFSLFLLIGIPNWGAAQKKESFTVANVAEKPAYEAVYQSFRELKLPFPMLNKSQGSGLTSFKTYKNLLWEYRFKYGIEWKNGNLKIFITEKTDQRRSGVERKCTSDDGESTEKAIGSS